MPTEIDLPRLQELMERDDLQLVEVLPEAEFTDEHLPGAVSIPLKSLTEKALGGLDRSRPTVVYCWDYL